jgi:hypothetical protein
MAKSLVQPEHLTDFVSSDAQTESGRLDRWIRGDNMTEALRVLELDGERKELFDIHIDYVTVFFDDALMHKLALKIDPNATRDLEGNFEALATENRHTDESIGCTLENGDLADDLSKVSIVCATLTLIVGELDPARSGPKLWGQSEMLDCPRIGDWQITAAICWAKVEIVTRSHMIVRRLWWGSLTHDKLL